MSSLAQANTACFFMWEAFDLFVAQADTAFFAFAVHSDLMKLPSCPGAVITVVPASASSAAFVQRRYRSGCSKEDQITGNAPWIF